MNVTTILGIANLAFGLAVIVFPRFLQFVVGAYFVVSGLLLLLF